jgi:AraC-like DNA-binding protein
MEERRTTSQPLREQLPIPSLRAYVSSVWMHELGPQSPPYQHRTIPNGSAELVCTVGSIPKLVGPQTRPTSEVRPPGTVTLGIRFRPGGAAAVLGRPPAEFVDLEPAADEIWGRGAIALGVEIATAPSPDAAMALVQSALVKRIVTRPTAFDPLVLDLVERLLLSPGDGVRAIAKSLYISERQLRRRCERETGLTPKALDRMFRFQRFLALAHADGSALHNLGRLARDAGYADQSHLSREAKRLADRTPRTVLNDCRRAHDHSLSHRLFLAGAVSHARSLRAAA